MKTRWIKCDFTIIAVTRSLAVVINIRYYKKVRSDNLINYINVQRKLAKSMVCNKIKSITRISKKNLLV